MSLTFDGLTVAGAFDRDGDLRFEAPGEVAYVGRKQAGALRDHLTVVLGEVDLTRNADAAPNAASAMSRDDALKLAEETVKRLAPGVDSRGYATSNAPALRDRVDSILRLADYLTGKGSA